MRMGARDANAHGEAMQRKLRVARQTIRALTVTELRGASGGDTLAPPPDDPPITKGVECTIGCASELVTLTALIQLPGGWRY